MLESKLAGRGFCEGLDAITLGGVMTCGIVMNMTFDSCMGAAGTDECPMPGGFDGTMATTALYISDRVGVAADEPVNTVQVGEIAYEILSCDEATATVTLDGADPVEFSATRLTGPFPCADEE